MKTLHKLIGLGLAVSVCQWRLTCSVMMWLTFGYLARKIAHVCQGVHGRGKAVQGELYSQTQRQENSKQR
jgi:hypothetical protein